MPITDPNTVATWIDLFDHDIPDRTVYEQDEIGTGNRIRASVHRWTRNAPTTQDLPPDEAGETEVSGTGGVNRVQPLSLNCFASFGNVESKVDSGVLRFTVGFVGAQGVADAETGVHFNTQPGTVLVEDGEVFTNVNQNSGYALLYLSSELSFARLLTLARITPSQLGQSVDRDDLAILLNSQLEIKVGDVIEVRWSQTPVLFGEPNNITVYVNPDIEPTPVLVHDFNIDDTDVHRQGGLLGVCAWESGADLGIEGSFITRFDYRNVIQPLSFYVDPATGAGKSYKNTFGGLYESDEPGGVTLFGNDPPDDYARFGLRKAGAVAPLNADGEELGPEQQRRIGFIAFGLSTSGQMFSAFMRMANDNEFLEATFGQRRNPLLTLVNCCQAGASASEVATQGAAHTIWLSTREKLESAGLAVNDLGGDAWEAPQVQVVWLNLGDVIGAAAPFSSEGAASGENIESMTEALKNIRDQLMLDRFPNLRLILCSDFPYMGWVTFADGGFSEPNMADSLRFGYRGMIKDSISIFRTPTDKSDPPWVGWLGELFGNIDLWPEKLFPRNNQGHPNAPGEETGAILLLSRLFEHFTSPAWWDDLSIHLAAPLDIVSQPASDNAWVRNYAPSYPRSGDLVSLETLSQKGVGNVVQDATGARFVGANQREKVFLKFSLPPQLANIRQAMLQLHYWSNEDYDTLTLRCTVRVVQSLDTNGDPWEGSTLTWEKAPQPFFLSLPEMETPLASREHPISVDVTDALLGLLELPGQSGGEVTFEIEPTDLDEGASEGPEGEFVETQFRWHSLADRLTNPTRSPQLILVARTLQPVGPLDFVGVDRRER